MKNDNSRYLLEVITLPETNLLSDIEADSTAFLLSNALNEYSQTPNAKAVCGYFLKRQPKLANYIYRAYNNFSISTIYHEPAKDKPGSILNAFESSQKGRLRVLLYPGDIKSIDEFKLPEATHNMIIQFDRYSPLFTAVKPHKHFPNFIQVVPSAEIAVLYIEGLLVDASMCHFIGISDAAMHHDDKQRISEDKVHFLFESVVSSQLEKWKISEKGILLIRDVVNQLDHTTPYISFFSIFTIASKCFRTDINKNGELEDFFTDYCILWEHFQDWYYRKYNRIIDSNESISSAINNLFDRNTYKGQMSAEAVESELHALVTNHKKSNVSSVLGWSNRYAFAILRNVPNNPDHLKKLESIFSGQIHQAKWKIMSCREIDKLSDLNVYFEFIPFKLKIDE